MSYVDTILEPGEQVRYRTTISWTVYANALWVGLAAAGVAYLAFKSNANWLFFASGALGVIALVLFAHGALQRAATEIAVTDRRIVFKRGLIRRHTVEMNMAKVESVDVDQTLLGRLFDYGDVTVRGVGSSFERLRNVDAPLKLRTTVTAG
jgi:membrane protein YdbS with pleckstrin-like domain